MTRINLKDLYPFYCEDCFMEVSDEIIEAIRDMERKEEAYRRAMFRHKAYYSLDRNDDIERDALLVSLTPEEYYERKITFEHLYLALTKLSKKQAHRIYAHYFMGLSYAAIARAEGVRWEVIRESIQAGLKALAKYYKNEE